MPANPRASAPPVAGFDHAPASRPGEAAGGEAAPTGGLSNDYLNLYSEVLMLIELAGSDPDMVGELAAWRPLSYGAYFAASPLRRAPAARDAYEALCPRRREVFEALTQAMDQLAHAAIGALQRERPAGDAGLVVEVTVPAFRRLIDRAACFLNSGGADIAPDGEVEAAQDAIDHLLERRGE